jgi:formylglycine-generating enzyme required for sulfatase activity
MAELSNRIDDILALPLPDRIDALLRIGPELVNAEQVTLNGVSSRAAQAFAALVEAGVGTPRQRLQLGELLGQMGDPRLKRPDDPAYWATVDLAGGARLQVGRYHVTTAEFQGWLAAGGYEDAAAWSAEGLAWLASGAARWSQLAAAPDAAHLVVANQPVAGPTFWEAEAYAKAHGARLLTGDEHRSIIRGDEKRPYPWGSPFGDGNANTREEALGRPCAVGLYRADQTPEGVFDLAGNMGEWLADEAGDRRLIHPGSWARPSMAAWAKALELVDPSERSADMSFRLAR